MRVAGRRRWIAALGVAVLAVGGGFAYSAIPDSAGVLHGCYSGKDGALRLIDTAAGQRCSKKETAVSWNQAGTPGPRGAPGPAGAAGPTVLIKNASLGAVPFRYADVISHTVTADEAGLTVMIASFQVIDRNGAAGGTTSVDCSLLVNGGGSGYLVTVSDNGSPTNGDSSAGTNMARENLKPGDVVTVACATVFNPEDADEAAVNADLLLEHVSG